MSSTVAVTGSPTSRRTLTNRSQSQENTGFEDEKPQMRSVSELSNPTYLIPISRTSIRANGTTFSGSVLFVYYSLPTSPHSNVSFDQQSDVYNPRVLISPS